jgi:hypothetical protein
VPAFRAAAESALQVVSRCEDEIRPIHVEVFGFERLLRSGGWILIHVSILA